jgi:hypothetical protein
MRAAANFEYSPDEKIERGNAGVFGNHAFNGRAEPCGKRVECVAADNPVVNRVSTAVAVLSCAIVTTAASARAA